jgi:hypothetical protein
MVRKTAEWTPVLGDVTAAVAPPTACCCEPGAAESANLDRTASFAAEAVVR